MPLGSACALKDHEATLLYLYWAPQNFVDIPELVTNKKEVKNLSTNISGSKPKFLAASYRELWDDWGNNKLRCGYQLKLMSCADVTIILI
jgi:hypothetical protein